jgi:hypothetical protein
MSTAVDDLRLGEVSYQLLPERTPEASATARRVSMRFSQCNIG